MTNLFQHIFRRYTIKTRFALEILTGLVSWTLIFSPIWASFLIPQILAYFILLFDVYWMYKSFSLAILAFIATNKIKEAEKQNWLEKAKKQDHFAKINHVIVIPNYKERYEKLHTTLSVLAKQTLSTKKIFVVLAMEEREEDGKEKANKLIHEFRKDFGDIFATYHPDFPGEVKGKSSNEAYGGKIAYEKLVKTKKIDLHYATISSV